MNIFPTTILRKKKILPDTYLFMLSPFTNGVTFYPGQYVFLKNAAYNDELHPFSIASSPGQKKYIELCIRAVGDWTKALSASACPILHVSNPQGKFIWDNTIQHAVFLLGGLGISPIMSMLRFITESRKKPLSITLLYGNRSPVTVAYKKELQEIAKKMSLKLVHIYSHIRPTHVWKGHRGFITKEIILQEIQLQNHPTFFVVGPPIFVEKMESNLQELKVTKNQVKKELLAPLDELST